MKIALAQINQTVGKYEENTQKILKFANEAKQQNADLIIFPEFAVCGGYCYDLFDNKDFVISGFKSAELITSQTPLHTICGVVTNDKLNRNITNAAALFYNDNMKVVSSKYNLNDSSFNDLKYFKFSGFSNVFKIFDKNVACIIADSVESIVKNIEKASWLGIDIAVVLSCSPYYKGKIEETKSVIESCAKENGVDVAYVNMLGAHDGYVFDGLSFYVDKTGALKAMGENFKECLTVFDTNGADIENKINDKNEELYNVLVLGLKDYMRKNNFKRCAVGVSGGIDSALTLAVAVDAIGSQNVLGVLMPSKYTSQESTSSALELCKNLNVQTKTVPIEKIYDIYIDELNPFFENKPKDLTEENLQARIRSNILMALSNKFGYFVLCTGNKSEDAVGYSTLYGDATGGYAPISDLLKKEVYELSKYRNSILKVIPDFIIQRAPSAELRENQKDSDSLPEYDVLDDVLEKIFDKKMSYIDILKTGVSSYVLYKIWKLISVSEYKRRQSPLGTKVSKTAFLRDINLPVGNGYVWKPMIEKSLSLGIEKE